MKRIACVVDESGQIEVRIIHIKNVNVAENLNKPEGNRYGAVLGLFWNQVEDRIAPDWGHTFTVPTEI